MGTGDNFWSHSWLTVPLKTPFPSKKIQRFLSTIGELTHSPACPYDALSSLSAARSKWIPAWDVAAGHFISHCSSDSQSSHFKVKRSFTSLWPGERLCAGCHWAFVCERGHWFNRKWVDLIWLERSLNHLIEWKLLPHSTEVMWASITCDGGFTCLWQIACSWRTSD